MGSSRNSSCGCTAQARASARRCCWPPDRARAGRRCSPSQADALQRSSATRCAPSRRGTPRQPQREAQVVQHRQAQHEGPLEHHRLRSRQRRPPRAGPGGAAGRAGRAAAWSCPSRWRRPGRRTRRAATAQRRPVSSARTLPKRTDDASPAGASSLAARSSQPRASAEPCAAPRPARAAALITPTTASSTRPSAIASGRSPLLVSSAIVVVITRVKPSMLPPTIITAPTSAMARPKAAISTVSTAQRSCTSISSAQVSGAGAHRAQLVAAVAQRVADELARQRRDHRQHQDGLRDDHRARA